MPLYDRVADLPLAVESVALDRTRAETSSGFERVTTTVTLEGPNARGHGEDVTYEAADHDRLARAGPPDLAGEYTLDEFSRALDDAALWPEPPEREAFRHYRRWAFESAALDLALRRADRSLADALDRTYDPVRFVVSTRLPGDPPTADRVEEWLAIDDTLEFKLDPTPEWSRDLCETLAATDAVRVLDFKGYYQGTVVDNPAGPDLYERVLEAFDDPVVEDPAVTDETRRLLADHDARVSFDAPVTSVDAARDLPVEPAVLNVKPSRFGTLESLLDFLEYAADEDVPLYGGGQFELDVGRQHLHALASAVYPHGPNDVAPRAYNRPEPTSGLPASPLDPPADPRGLDW